MNRLEIQEDTKIPNAATIKVLKQDHTLANMLRACVPSLNFSPSSTAYCCSDWNLVGSGMAT